MHFLLFLVSFCFKICNNSVQNQDFSNISTVLSTEDPWLELGSLFLNIIFYSALSEMNKRIMRNNFLTVQDKKKCLKQNVLRIMQRTYRQNFSLIGALFLSSALKGMG